MYCIDAELLFIASRRGLASQLHNKRIIIDLKLSKVTHSHSLWPVDSRASEGNAGQVGDM